MEGRGENTARQPPKLASGNIPYHRCHAQFTNRVGGGGGFFSVLLICMSLNSLWSGSSHFSATFAKFMILGFHDLCSGTDYESVIGW